MSTLLIGICPHCQHPVQPTRAATTSRTADRAFSVKGNVVCPDCQAVFEVVWTEIRMPQQTPKARNVTSQQIEYENHLQRESK